MTAIQDCLDPHLDLDADSSHVESVDDEDEEYG